jgi:tetratricopeptide (TPR) repeat protein
MASRYQEEVGPTAASCLQLALAQRAVGRRNDAVDTLRRGLEDDPGSLVIMTELALTLPIGRMAVLAGAFASMPDRSTAFEPLARALLAAGAHDAVIALARELRVYDPAHPTAPLYEAEAQAAAGRAAAGVTLLREAMATASPANRPAYQSRLAETLLQDGRPLEAYEALPDPAAAFDLVAVRLAGRRDAAALARLVSVHQERFATDPALPYSRGLVIELQGRLDEAPRVYLKAYRETADEPARRRLHRAAVTCMYRAGALTKAYDTIEPRHETAEILARLCARDGEDRQLERLYETHVRRMPDDKAWRRWAAELSFLRGDYLAAKIGIDAVRAACLDRPDLARWYDDRLVRTLVRLGRHGDALRAARDATRRLGGDAIYEFIVFASWGRPVECYRVARGLVTEGRYDVESLYQDPDCRENLESNPAFEPFREALPRRGAAAPAPSLSAAVWE